MKSYSAFPKALESHWIVQCHIKDTNKEEVLPLHREAVGVFYSPSRLGKETWRAVTLTPVKIHPLELVWKTREDNNNNDNNTNVENNRIESIRLNTNGWRSWSTGNCARSLILTIRTNGIYTTQTPSGKLGVMAMKLYSTFLKDRGLESHHQMPFSVIPWALIRGYSSAEIH